MKIHKQANPFVAISALIGLVVAVICMVFKVPGLAAGIAGASVGAFLALYVLYFFRDPDRSPNPDPKVVVSGADGTIMSVTEVDENEFLKTRAVRISTFLSLVDVHINRAPIAGKVKFAQYYPGKRYFTFLEKSSEYNQHSSIHIEGSAIKCVVNQIVGPVARRVVYWINVGQELAKGERFGLMKFGSRLDLYLPKDEVEVLVKVGDKVAAGDTIVARLKKG